MGGLEIANHIKEASAFVNIFHGMCRSFMGQIAS
uniref:Uncharacterized protein n=1 Tax=Rhizophora mucronata TaxID=61149 RepID=A0A2P2Q9X5_RHIMU